jgi:hypothetical protein
LLLRPVGPQAGDKSAPRCAWQIGAKSLKGLLIKPQRILLVDRHRVIHQQPGLLHGIPGEQRQLSDLPRHLASAAVRRWQR